MARLILLEPGEVKSPSGGADLGQGTKCYAGFASPGDEMYFHHVETCCAVLVFGDKVVAGGHMGQNWGDEYDLKTGDFSSKMDTRFPPISHNRGDLISRAGRYVWTLVAATHNRHNSKDGAALLLIGSGEWFGKVNESIKNAIKPKFLQMFSTDTNHGDNGVNILVTVGGNDIGGSIIRVQDCKTKLWINKDLTVPVTYNNNIEILPM